MKMHRIPNALFLVAALLLTTSLSAITWEDSDGGFLNVAALKQLSAAATKAHYPDADTVLLDSEMRVEYQADGTYVQVADNATKVLTLAGVDEVRVLQSFYSASYSRAKISLVQILKANGETITLDLSKCTQEMVEDSQMRSNIYDPNHKVVKVSVAGVEPGDTVRAVYVDETTKPRVPNSYSGLFPLEDTSPIRHSRIVIDAPSALPLQSTVVKDISGKGPTRKEAKVPGGRHTYTWEVENVPQAFPEPSAPPLAYSLQRLAVSTFRSWEEVSRWYSELCEPRLTLNDEIRKEVATLTEKCTTDEEKLIALYNFVSQRVRYMGLTLEDTAPGYEPHDVALTFEQRAGVCRDMAALLVAMFRAAGYDSHPTLIHVGSPKDEEVPQPYFNHAITAVRLAPDAPWRLMDPTNTNTRKPFPAYLDDKSYLVATPQGDPLRLSPVSPYQENLLRIATSGKLADDGTILLGTQILFGGITDNAYRNYFLNSTAEERRVIFERQLASLLPGAKLRRLEILPADLQDLTEPLQAKITYAVPDFLIAARNADGTADRKPGDTAMLRFPRLADAFGLNLMVFGRAGLEKRRFPLNAGQTIGVSEETDIALPETLEVLSTPEYASIDDESMILTRSVEALPGHLRMNALYATKAMRFSPEQYLALKKALARKSADDRKMAVLRFCEPPTEAPADEKPAEPPPDLEYDEISTWVAVATPSSWVIEKTIRFRVLTYAGIDMADITENFNPAWDELEVLKATVTNSGKSVETPPQNINVMDAGWAASAPRYPAGKQLVVNLPGVDIGSVVEVRTRRTVTRRPFFFLTDTFRTDNPVKKWSLELISPKELDLSPKFYANGWLDLQSDLKDVPKCKEKVSKLPENTIRHYYEMTDIPALHHEGALPPSYTYLPTLVVTAGDWKRYATNIRSVVESLGDGGEAVRALTAPWKEFSIEQRVIQVRDWIEKNIRGTEPPFNAMPLSFLTAPEITLRDGYGNSADRAILYRAMLDALGIPSELYLASLAPQMEELQRFVQKFPRAGLFGNWLVKTEVNGEEVWLNDQSQYAQFGTSVFDHGMLLSLAKGRLERLELPKEYRDDEQSQWKIEIGEDGTALIEIRNFVKGDSFGAQKRFYDRLTPEERRRHYETLVSGVAQGAKPVTKDLETDFVHYPGCTSYTVKVQDFATFDGNYCYLRLPIGIGGALADARADRNFHPLFRAGFQNEELTIDLTFPKGYDKVVLAPRDFQWSAPGGMGSILWKSREIKDNKRGADAPRRFRFTLTTDMRPGVVTLKDFPKFQEAARRLLHPDSTTLLLMK